LRHIEQWQCDAPDTLPLISKRTSPHRQLPADHRGGHSGVLRQVVGDLEPRRLVGDEDMHARPHARVVVERAQRQAIAIAVEVERLSSFAPQTRQKPRCVPGDVSYQVRALRPAPSGSRSRERRRGCGMRAPCALRHIEQWQFSAPASRPCTS
jgi:hypothetical protein